jgi:hypothetical protein
LLSILLGPKAVLVNPDTTKEKEREHLERRVESLASEIAELINTSEGEERNDLKDLALSIVREEVRSGAESAEGSEAEDKAEGPFNPIAMAIPVFLIGAVMVVLFPPVGLLLLGLAGLLVFWGVSASMFARMTGRG